VEAELASATNHMAVWHDRKPRCRFSRKSRVRFKEVFRWRHQNKMQL